MANTLTGLIPVIYDSLNIVSREMTGFIPAVTLSAKADEAGLNESVRIPVAGVSSLADNTPAATSPNTGSTTDEYVDLSISKSKHYPIAFTGEEIKALGANYNPLLQNKISEGFRAIVNAVEADLATIYKDASRAYGTAGTAPFATKDDLSDFAGVNQILDDNGAPTSDRQIVLGSAAIFNMRAKQTGLLQKVNESGSMEALRMGVFGDIHGLTLRNSGQVAAHTKGTATGYDLTAAFGIGSTTLTVDGSDSGTILNGDVVTFAGDSNKYIVKSSTASGGLSGNIVLNNPGLVAALADTTEGTTGASYRANLAFSRSAIVLATRIPAVPDGGDMADDRILVTDPITGLVFEVAIYRQYRQIHMEIGLAWGWKGIKSNHIAVLLG